MASLQHVYRRGHIFWWRRVHSSFHNTPIDVRLSLGTPDRLQARNRGAVLTASYDRVVTMLNDHVRANRELTERELQAIAKAMYEEHEHSRRLSDPFFMALLGHLADELTARGYEVMLSRVISNADDWLDRTIGSGMLDGVLLVGQSDQFATIERVAAQYRPMVA